MKQERLEIRSLDSVTHFCFRSSRSILRIEIQLDFIIKILSSASWLTKQQLKSLSLGPSKIEIGYICGFFCQTFLLVLFTILTILTGSVERFFVYRATIRTWEALVFVDSSLFICATKSSSLKSVANIPENIPDPL